MFNYLIPRLSPSHTLFPLSQMQFKFIVDQYINIILFHKGILTPIVHIKFNLTLNF